LSFRLQVLRSELGDAGLNEGAASTARAQLRSALQELLLDSSEDGIMASKHQATAGLEAEAEAVVEAERSCKALEIADRSERTRRRTLLTLAGKFTT
jgi:hypothetical protein